MTRKKPNKLPSIYLDENVSPKVETAFKPIFRTFQISRHKKYKGRDEKDYIAELYSANGIFVTSDIEFVNYVQDNEIKHAGIIFLPEQMTQEEKIFFAELAGGFINGGCDSSSCTFRNFIFYPGHDGLRTINNNRDEMEFSWDRLFQEIQD